MNEIKLRANLPISRDITTRFLAFLLKKMWSYTFADYRMVDYLPLRVYAHTTGVYVFCCHKCHTRR